MLYAEFVHQVVEALQQRPLGQGSLQYCMEKLATSEMAKVGEWVEFGSFSGTTIRYISNKRKELGGTRVVHGFDSFQGLPSTWRHGAVGGEAFDDSYTSAGSFDRHGEPPFQDPQSVQWHVGWFNETAAEFANDGESFITGNITFAHMDADIYESTAQAFKALEHRLGHGVFVVFDELIGYPEYQEHEMKALYELLQRSKRTLNIIGYPGPRVLESPDAIREGIRLQGSESGSYPQNALMQIV